MSQDKQDSGVQPAESVTSSDPLHRSEAGQGMSLVGVLVILSALALMPVGEGAFNMAIAAMGVMGLIALVRMPWIVSDHRFRLVVMLFACLWVPMTISLLGAAEPGRAMRTTLAFLRFPIAAAFVIITLRHGAARWWLAVGVFIIAAAWSVDGMIQWLSGRNLLGFPYDGTSVTGLFHPKRVIGLLLAALLPMALEFAWTVMRRRPAVGVICWLLVATMPLVILLGGSRTSWMMLVVGLVSWLVFRYLRSDWRYKSTAAIAVLVALLAATPFVLMLPGIAHRVEQTGKLLEGDYESINEATSGRLPVWRIAVAISRDNWLTGVGPRGYRYLYPEYADDETPWVSPDGQTGAAHPHQTVLEVLAETGVIGLAGFALFWLLLVRAMWYHGNERRRSLPPDGHPEARTSTPWPWAIAVLLVFFPLNTHMAVYGTYWSHFSWWLVLIMVALLSPGHKITSGRSDYDGNLGRDFAAGPPSHLSERDS